MTSIINAHPRLPQGVPNPEPRLCDDFSAAQHRADSISHPLVSSPYSFPPPRYDTIHIPPSLLPKTILTAISPSQGQGAPKTFHLFEVHRQRTRPLKYAHLTASLVPLTKDWSLILTITQLLVAPSMSRHAGSH